MDYEKVGGYDHIEIELGLIVVLEDEVPYLSCQKSGGTFFFGVLG